jgi:hypothetical protein
MRKAILLVVVALLAISIAAPPARALVLTAGEFKGALTDSSSIYVLDQDGLNGVPRAPDDASGAAGGEPAGGDYSGLGFADTTVTDDELQELRVLFHMDAIQTNDFFYSNPDDFGTLAGLLYDLQVVDVEVSGAVTTLYFAPLGRNPIDTFEEAPIAGIAYDDGAGHSGTALPGGVMELWMDSTPPGADPGDAGDPAETTFFDPNDDGMAPQAWGEGDWAGADDYGHAGGAGQDDPDTYPEVNDDATDAVLWLQAVLTPFVDGSGVPLLSPNTFSPYVWQEVIVESSRSGSALTAYLDIVGGSAKDLFDRNVFGPGRDVEVKASLVLPATGNVYTSPGTAYEGTQVDDGNWAVLSDDPFRGRISVIPEPATLSLLGLGLLGLVGMRRKK